MGLFRWIFGRNRCTKCGKQTRPRARTVNRDLPPDICVECARGIRSGPPPADWTSSSSQGARSVLIGGTAAIVIISILWTFLATLGSAGWATASAWAKMGLYIGPFAGLCSFIVAFRNHKKDPTVNRPLTKAIGVALLLGLLAWLIASGILIVTGLFWGAGIQPWKAALDVLLVGIIIMLLVSFITSYF